MKHFFLVFLFLIGHGFCFLQNSNEVLLKVLETNRKENVKNYDLVYNLYRIENLNTPVETYYGEVVQNDKSFYHKIENTEIIQNTDLVLSVDNDLKIVQMNTPVKKLVNHELELIYKECDSVSSKVKNDRIELILSFSPLSQLPFSKVVFSIHSTTYRIENTVFYYSILQDFSTEMNVVDQSYPVLSVTAKNFTQSIESKMHLLDQKKYIKKVNGKYVVSSELSEYSLIDER